MSKVARALVLLTNLTVFFGSSAPTPAQTPAAHSPNQAVGSPPWPRVFDRNGVHVIVYQPQLKAWQKYRTLVADTAISITDPGKKPVLGVISWRAETFANVSAQTVYISHIEVLSARFPSLDSGQDALMQARVHQLYPTMTLTIGLPRMIASLEKVNEPARSITPGTEVPSIMASYAPSILLMVDGKTVLAPIQGTSLEYVVNANWDLFYDKSDYYLLNGKSWLKATELSGPWTATSKLPPEMAKLPPNQNWDTVLKAIPPVSGAAAPHVLFSNKPAELLAFQGKPNYAKIPGTDLAYATNTQSNVFVHEPDKQVYVLLSGRWFRATTLDGPWSYAGDSLPPDFAKIPKGHPYSVVLVSVPGTQEASDAVLLAQVPTTAIVNRAQAEAQVKVAYAGSPQFEPIPTTTMTYAVNTPDKVIRVGDIYYLCFQGVWFMSKTPNGPWKTVDSVPTVIYTIPPSSPVYNVTYVVVSNPTPTTVQTSYSSGYLGVFVVGMAVGSAVVYGTGYYYPPYVYWGPRYPVYYPYPYTYGVAAVYNPYTGAYGVGRAVYGPYGSAGTAAWYNPTTGTYGRAVTTQNAYGGHTYAQAYNPWTGTYAATSQGHNQYSSWGNSVVTNGDNWATAQHGTNSNGSAGSFQTSKGSAGAGFSGANGNSGFVAKDANNNNVYAGADGNVYKKDSSGNWSKYDNGGWTPVDPSTGAAQTRQKTQGSNGTTTITPKAQTPGASGQAQATPRASGQTTQRQPTPQTNPGNSATPNNTTPNNTMGQLQNDSQSRDRGNQLEQSQNRGSGAPRGAQSGGARRPR